MACLVATVVAVANAQAVQNFNVTASGTTAYLIDGVANKPLTLTRGKTYTFTLDVSGHPFDIKTVAGSGAGNRFNDGVSAQAQESGVVTFQVPSNAPGTLFYQCERHDPMSAAITTLAPPPAPAFGPFAILILSALVVGAGFLLLRKRVFA